MRSPLRGPGEIAEDEAGPELAAGYARIRTLLGVPFVPTVYRMLARHESFLLAGIQAHAALLSGRVARDFALAARNRAADAAAGLDLPALPAGSARTEARELVERYGLANPRNLLFSLALAGGGPKSPARVMRAPLPDSGAELLTDIRACHGDLTVPGLWRELAAARPELARAAWAQVRPLAGDERFASAQRDVLAMGREAVAAASAPVRALGEEDASAGELLNWFIPTIATMIVEGEILRRGMSADAD